MTNPIRPSESKDSSVATVAIRLAVLGAWAALALVAARPEILFMPWFRAGCALVSFVGGALVAAACTGGKRAVGILLVVHSVWLAFHVYGLIAATSH